jgi:hypothetical protein
VEAGEAEASAGAFSAACAPLFEPLAGATGSFAWYPLILFGTVNLS